MIERVRCRRCGVLYPRGEYIYKSGYQCKTSKYCKGCRAYVAARRRQQKQNRKAAYGPTDRELVIALRERLAREAIEDRARLAEASRRLHADRLAIAGV
jgi:hypothetical protein